MLPTFYGIFTEEISPYIIQSAGYILDTRNILQIFISYTLETFTKRYLNYLARFRIFESVDTCVAYFTGFERVTD